MDQPKRVILRYDASEFKDNDPDLIGRLYFENCGRSFDEFLKGRHFIHIQPPSPGQSKCHVIIDMEKNQFSGTLPEDFPHEVYRVRRINEELKFLSLPQGVQADNFIRQARQTTDSFYPWGMTTKDLRNIQIMEEDFQQSMKEGPAGASESSNKARQRWLRELGKIRGGPSQLFPADLIKIFQKTRNSQ